MLSSKNQGPGNYARPCDDVAPTQKLHGKSSYGGGKILRHLLFVEIFVTVRGSDDIIVSVTSFFLFLCLHDDS